MLVQVSLQPVQGEVYALALQARPVVMYEGGTEQRRKAVVAKASLHYPFGYMHAFYMSGLAALHQVELRKAAAFIPSAQQLHAGLVHVGQRVCLIRLYAGFPQHTLAGLLIRIIHVIIAEHGFKAAAVFVALLFFCFALRLPALVSCLPAFLAGHLSSKVKTPVQSGMECVLDCKGQAHESGYRTFAAHASSVRAAASGVIFTRNICGTVLFPFCIALISPSGYFVWPHRIRGAPHTHCLHYCW